MLLFVLIVVAGLWANGRYWRSRWSLASSEHLHLKLTKRGDPRTRTLVVMWTGAFNDATIHFERLIPLYRSVGDVYVVGYADLRFDSDAAMRDAYKFAREHGYETVILVGASLGGLLALRFVEHCRSRRDDFSPVIKLVAADVPLNKHDLPQPEWLLNIVKYVHIGPVFNLFSPLITRLVLKKLPADQMNGVRPGQLIRHMAALWRCELSVMAEQISSIVTQLPFKNVADIPTVYLMCANDDVINGDRALRGWRALLGTSLLAVIDDIEGGHVQFVEKHSPWLSAHQQALRALGYRVS